MRLVSPHTSRLKRLARRFTRNAQDAEDVCQESLLKAFTKLHYFADSEGIARGEFQSWLSRITANSAIDFLRRKQAAVSFEECEPVHQVSAEGAWAENPEMSYARQERLRMVTKALSRLPADLQKVCVLRDMMELSTKEVAARLGLPTVSVRVRLFRAHNELRKIFAGGAPEVRGKERQPNQQRRIVNRVRERNRQIDAQLQSRPAFACGD